jgi:transcriptional regulator with PAS, ATPase and Fis domain
MSKGLTQRTEFYDVWRKFVSSGDISRVPIHIRPSWERCQKAHLDPQKGVVPITTDQNSIQKRIDEQPDLLQIVQSHSKNIERCFDFLPLGIIFFDRDGYILSVYGDEDILKLLEDKNIKVGEYSKEYISGTSAPAICLEEKRFAMVNAEEHYLQAFHWASCIAAPIFDGEQNLLGSLDLTVTSRDAKRLRYLTPILLNTANSIQFEFSLKRKLEQLELFHSYYRSTFDYSRSILVLVDKRGGVIDLNKNAQEVLEINPEEIINRDIRSILDDKCKIESLLKGSGGKISFSSRTSELFSTESIPIFDRSGEEIAFLLNLEKERVHSVMPERSSNVARYMFGNIIGASPKILDVIEKAKKAAKTGSNVLIEGETGTGKELFAHAIHNESAYCEGPFVALNCAAIPRELIESELFGYEKGAYTGALPAGNAGKFELANEGTIFLDEIHNMDLPAQTKMLRVIEDRRVTRIGGKYAIPLDIRIIVATSVNLGEEMERGQFVPGLFYRLNVVKLHIPSLRERKEDIPTLVNYFVGEMNQKFKRSIRGVEPEVLNVISQYSWPGNVRELRNCIESAFNFCSGEFVSLNDLANTIAVKQAKETAPGQTMDDITKNLFVESLNRFGNVKQAADSLGIPISTFYRRTRKFGISL